MDQILETLSSLSKTPRLVSAEQILMVNVFFLGEYITSDLSSEKIAEIEKVLYSLFLVNKSQISVQCSLYISSIFLKLFKIKKDFQLFDVINFTITNPSPPTILLSGYICKDLGNKSKAQIPHFIDFLLKQTDNNLYSAVYALRACFKASDALNSYIRPSIDFVRDIISQKALADKTQCLLPICIKFLKEIVPIPDAPLYEIADIAKYIASHCKVPLVNDDVADLVSRCAFAPHFSKIDKI